MKKVRSTDYRLLTSPAEITSLCTYLAGEEHPVAFDYETTCLYPWKGKIRSVAVAWKEGQAWCFDPSQAPEAWLEFLESDTPKVAQKYAYELSWTLKEYGVTPNNVIFDTKIGSRMIDENVSSSLGEIVERFVPQMSGLKDYAPDFESDEWKRGEVPIEGFYVYNCMDAEATILAYYAMEWQVELPLMAKTIGHIETLGRARDRGIRVKSGADRALKIRAKTEVPRLLEKMAEDSATYRAFMKQNGGHINVKSHKQKKLLLMGYLGLPEIHKSRDTDEPTLDAKYLEYMSDREPLCATIASISSWRTLDTNFLKNLQDTLVDGRIHPDWGVGNANTWRISCSRPNMQNLPKGSPILDVIIPDEGKILVEMDYSQMELRILAVLTGDETLTNAYADGVDVHRMRASTLFKVDPEDVTDAQRSRAKAINFGMPYGITKWGLWRKEGIPMDEGGPLVEAFWESSPRIRTWCDERHEEGEETGYVTNLFGRVRHLPDLLSDDWKVRNHAKNQAQNFPVQSVSGEVTLDAMVQVEKELPWVEILGQKHDSILFQTDVVRCEEAIQCVREIMVGQGDAIGVRFEVDAKVGLSWGDLKDYESSCCV